MMKRRGDRFEGLISDLAEDSDGDQEAPTHDVEAGWGDGLMLSMFRDDFAQLMPRGIPRDASTISASDDVTDIVAAGLPTHFGPMADLPTAVADFIHSVAYQLLDGPITFDVEYLRRTEAEHPVMFRFVPRWGTKPSSRTRLLPLPDGAPATVRFDLSVKTRKRLDEARPIWATADLPTNTAMRLIGAPGYDFEVQRTATNQAVLQSTWDIGWDGRGTFTDMLLEPMRIALRLRFMRLQIRTRDDLLKQLQMRLHEVGAALQADLSLTFTGLNDESDITAAERSLQRGDTKLSELFRLQA
jgi:hypothetical protein